ncbi:DUF6083 domain-containing protein [Streptomyces canus]|uniref:DUF6083 domain-containing protein n=1 Tax=Streptomyces canus TaxID=58343 RepID=UPI00386C9B42
MRSSSTSRPWGGSPAVAYPRRSLRIEHDSPSRLLRCAQPDRCRECGNPVEWYDRSIARPVPLHPREVPAAEVPIAYRWARQLWCRPSGRRRQSLVPLGA